MQQATTAAHHASRPHPGEEQYEALLGRSRARIAGIGQTFTTDAEGLFAAFLGALPPDRRQHYNCHACRRFIDGFGGLVALSESGEPTSALWDTDETPAFFAPSVTAMLAIIRRAKVTGVLLSDVAHIGHAMTIGNNGETWNHFSGTVPVRGRSPINASQAMAAKREDRNNVARALAEYTKPMVDEALRVLRTDALYRSEKVLGAAEWLAAIHAAREGAKGPRRDNVLWRAIASAPDGFCHPRSSMIGTLLDDIAAGLPFDDVAKRFAAKMHPLQYQRPQAPPTSGAIQAAEKLVEKMGIARSLERRYARLDEIETLWLPKAPKVDETKGVFGHLKPKGTSNVKALDLPCTSITWEKFARTILPTADAIEYHAYNTRAGYVAYVTAVHADSPPILQWDSEAKRNQVSHYTYHGGSLPQRWNITPGWVRVTGVSLKPYMWGERPLPHHGKGVLFVLDGARDVETAPLCLFPEFLRSELHGARSVIEAHSRSGVIQGREQASACGIVVPSDVISRFRVTSGGSAQEFQIDRWD